MSLRKLRFSVFVIKTYSGTGKRDFNLGLCFSFFRFCSLPRALTSALIGLKLMIISLPDTIILVIFSEIGINNLWFIFKLILIQLLRIL